ncbi:MAG: hypothetical protein J5630_03890 [Bacteroidaceae bacterium]|nr:hypothetical protein [Bacteroidaceae bacterium]
MKTKLFTLLTMLMVCVGSMWASVSFVEGRPYTIKHSSSGLYVNIETAGQNAKLSATFSVVYFTASGDKWTISNLTNSLYATSWHAQANASNSTPWTIAEVSGKDDTYTLNQQSSDYQGYLGSDDTTEGSVMYCNKNPAQEFVIEEFDFYFAPTIPSDALISIGEKTNSFTVASSASDNAHWYLITNRRKKNVDGQQEDESYNTPIYFTGAGNRLKREAQGINPAAINNNPISLYIKDLVRFVSDGNGGYNLQFANGAFVDASLQGTYSQSEAGNYRFYNITDGGYQFGWNLKDGDKIVDNNGQGETLAFWSTGNVESTTGNNVWGIYPVTFFNYVTYIVKDVSDNTLFTSNPVATTNGAKITTLPTEYQRNLFYTYNTVDVTISSNGNTNVEFTATPKADAPVKYTADTSNPYYYNLSIRSKYLAYNDEATGDVELLTTSTPFNPNAAWAFIGDPYTGFKIINQTNGTDKYLTYTSVVTGSNHNNNNIQFVDAGDFANKYWYVETNTGGICLRMKENMNIYFHHDNGSNYLRTCSTTEWSSVHNDEGSTIVASTDENILIALYNNMKDWSFGTSIGQMNTADASVVTNEQAASTISNVGAAISGETTSAYSDCYTALTTIKNNMSLVEPTAGFYRLKNVATGKYLTAVSGPQAYDVSTRGVYASNSDGNSAASIIRLYDKDGDGHLYMYNQGSGFGWVVAGASVGAGVGYLSTNPDKYVNWFPGMAAGQIAFAICYGNGTGDYTSYLEKGIYTVDTSDEAVIGGTDYKADAAQWIVEEATTATIPLTAANDNTGTAHTYATLCVPFNITALEGVSSKEVKAYAPTKSDNYIVPGDGATTITAGTPVLLIGEEGATSVTATIGSNYASSPATTNALRGTFTGTSIDCTAETRTNYVLGFDRENDNRIGFYHVNSSSYNLKANRAYLNIGAGGDARGFYINFDDVVTGISSMDNGQWTMDNESVIYNLSGQRLNKMQKGINIVNGKKVLF